MKEQSYLTTRPRLATIAANSGATVKLSWNPYNPDKKAWTITLTPDIAALIADFHKSIDKPVPDVVKSYMKGLKSGEPK